MSKSIIITEESVINKIYIIKGKKVMIDRDLAEMYGIETRLLNQAVKRNEKRFPGDFMFQLTGQELEEWKSQNAMSNRERMGLRKLPNVFTEQGVAMLSSVLNSEIAIEVNIQIIRIFTHVREVLTNHIELRLEIDAIRRKVDTHGKNIELVFRYLDELLERQEKPNPPRKRIGYKPDTEV